MGKGVSDASNTPIPTADEFRAAVRYVLIHQHCMPELVADEVLNGDADFLEHKRCAFHAQGSAIESVADELAFRPPSGVKWVRLEEGERKASANQAVVDVNEALDHYLQQLLELGLHGHDRDAVLNAMLARGIESVFPLLSSASAKQKPARR